MPRLEILFTAAMISLAGCGAAAAAPVADTDVTTLYWTDADHHGKRFQAATFDAATFDTAHANQVLNKLSCKEAADLFNDCLLRCDLLVRAGPLQAGGRAMTMRPTWRPTVQHRFRPAHR